MINLPPNLERIATEAMLTRPAWQQWFMQVFRACFAIYQSGTTAQRPTVNLWAGRPYFDTTLGMPIWYDGTAWVKGDGTAA